MDDHRFDQLTRAFAGGISRRRMLGVAGLAAGWASLRRSPSLAQDDRDDGSDIEIAGVDDSPCALVACPPDKRCVAGACCLEGQICGETCCPPESIGCTAPPSGPDGPLGQPGCLCPGSLGYDARTNTCLCVGTGDTCASDDDCCVSEWEYTPDETIDFADNTATVKYGRCLDGVCQCCPRYLDPIYQGSYTLEWLGASDICCGPGQWSWVCCTALWNNDCTDAVVGCCEPGDDCKRSYDACSGYFSHVDWPPHPEACAGGTSRG